MPTTYTNDDGDITKIVDAIKSEYFQDLMEVDVTIEILIAHNPAGDAVKHHGWPAYAVIKANSLKDRVAGCKDVRLIVDGALWEEMTGEQQCALIHHELYHLIVKRDEIGSPMLDDVGRPLLKIRKHDFQCGGFDEIAKRYGPSAGTEHALWLAMGRDQKQSFEEDSEQEAAA